MVRPLFRILFKIAPFAYMILIWILSSLPSDAVVKTQLSFDRGLKESLHLIEFAILYGLLILFFLVDGKFTYKKSIVSACISIAYGFVDETHQYFVPYRSATVIDLVKDAIGVAVFFYIVKISYFGEKLPRVKRVMVRIEELSEEQRRKVV